MLEVYLLTRGSPSSLTGGHLYHRRMAEAACAHDASITFGQAGLRSGSAVDRFDVVVVDSITAWRLAAQVSRRGPDGPPLVAMAHQPPGGIGTTTVRRVVQGGLDRFVYARCDVVIAASRELGESLVQDHGLDPARVRVVEPGCDLPVGTPDTSLRRGRRVAVLCVANWLPQKGVLELIDAVLMLPAGDATLHLVGRDDVDRRYSRRIHRKLAASESAGRVVVHGPVDRQTVADLYAGADVFALPTYVETYGTVFAEALSAGVPTVGWRTGNLPNLITEGVEGFLVAPGDVAALSEVLGRLANDDAARAGLASAARLRGATLPTWADAASAFFTILRDSMAHPVEPADHRTRPVDVDAADARVLDIEPPSDASRHVERPGERCLDRADVGDDHHD